MRDSEAVIGSAVVTSYDGVGNAVRLKPFVTCHLGLDGDFSEILMFDSVI